jgi:hypothetical protein
MAPDAQPESFGPDADTRGRGFGRLRVLSLDDARNAPPRRYLLRGLVARGELSVWWGPPKAGKSFLTLRLFYGLALGRGMWGRRATPARVLYVAAEGEGGIGKRLLALADALGDAGAAFHYIAQPAQVGEPQQDLEDLAEAARACSADVIVLDTLARTFGAGDENSAADMGAYVAACDRLRRETGAHVAIVHHSRKDGSDIRGSGALFGAVDLSVQILPPEGPGLPHRAIVHGSKDDASGAEMPFALRQVTVGRDEEGEPITTCIAEEAQRADSAAAKPLSPQQQHALNILSDLTTAEGEELPSGPGWPMPGSLGVRIDRLRDECDRARVSDARDEDDRRRSIDGALTKLANTGRIGRREDWAWLAGAGEQQRAALLRSDHAPRSEGDPA